MAAVKPRMYFYNWRIPFACGLAVGVLFACSGDRESASAASDPPSAHSAKTPAADMPEERGDKDPDIEVVNWAPDPWLSDADYSQQITVLVKESRRKLTAISDERRAAVEEKSNEPAKSTSLVGNFCGDLGQARDDVLDIQGMLPSAVSGLHGDKIAARRKIQQLIDEIKREIDETQSCAARQAL
jgi:hypothetical protein